MSPAKVPFYILPQIPPADRFSTGWLDDLNRWKADIESILFRNWKAVESLPLSTYARSSTALTLTTTPTLVPGLDVILTVPPGGIVQAHCFLDWDTTGVTCIGYLFSKPPSATTHSQVDGTSNNIIKTGTFRATIGTCWQLNNPLPGGWGFQVRAELTSGGAVGSGGVISTQHSILQVTVI